MATEAPHLPTNTRALDAPTVVEKIGTLSLRIRERFPQSSLARVCADLHLVAQDTQHRLVHVARPNWWLRGAIGLFIALILVGTVLAFSSLIVVERQLTLSEFLSAVEAGINDLILISAAIFFLFTLDSRLRRRRVLAQLQELRALAHVVDMHQLTKDPARLLTIGSTTPSSPRESLTAFELQRYLDYSSEMLSLIGKLAALYIQNVDDGVVLSTVNEIEDLTNGISRKIWQKIMIIHSYDSALAAINSEATSSGIFAITPLETEDPPPAA